MVFVSWTSGKNDQEYLQYVRWIVNIREVEKVYEQQKEKCF